MESGHVGKLYDFRCEERRIWQVNGVLTLNATTASPHTVDIQLKIELFLFLCEGSVTHSLLLCSLDPEEFLLSYLTG